jgi:hypothetical protein
MPPTARYIIIDMGSNLFITDINLIEGVHLLISGVNLDQVSPEDASEAYTAVQFHPDGLILGTGRGKGGIDKEEQSYFEVP